MELSSSRFSWLKDQKIDLFSVNINLRSTISVNRPAILWICLVSKSCLSGGFGNWWLNFPFEQWQRSHLVFHRDLINVCHTFPEMENIILQLFFLCEMWESFEGGNSFFSSWTRAELRKMSQKLFCFKITFEETYKWCWCWNGGKSFFFFLCKFSNLTNLILRYSRWYHWEKIFPTASVRYTRCFW